MEKGKSGHLLFPRAYFFDHLERCCQKRIRQKVLALVEINNSYQVARLLQGVQTENIVISTFEQRITSFLSGYACEALVKIQHHQFGIVLNYSAREAVEILSL